MLKSPSVFIVSSGRSGTTLLVSILNAAEQIYIPYESDFIARAYPYFGDKNNIDENDYKRIVKFFQLTSKEQGWGLSSDYLLSFLQEHRPKTFAEINSSLCAAFHKLEGTENLLWGIKAPVLIASLEIILKTCPQAKIVHIVRDGRDIYLSYKKIHEKSPIKFGPKGIISSTLYWIDGLQRIQEFQIKQGNKQIYELRYEDLLCSPEYELKKLCNFLDIEWRSSMYENFYSLERNQKVAPQNLMRSIHSKIQGDIDPKNAYKYLNMMSISKQLIFEAIAIPYLKKYDYKIKFSWLDNPILAILRFLLYCGARKFNNWRYRRRDRLFYLKSECIIK